MLQKLPDDPAKPAGSEPRNVFVVTVIKEQLQKLGGAVYIRVKINGKVVFALLDTGCEHSLAGSKCLQDIELSPSKDVLHAANGTEIPVLGLATVVLESDSFKSTTTFLVSDLVSEVILGNDWLEQEDCMWVFRKKCLTVNGLASKLYIRNAVKHRVRRMYATDDVDIPARELTAVPTRVIWTSVGDDTTTFMSEPHSMDEGMVVARTVIDPKTFEAMMPVVNLTHLAYRVAKGTFIGEAVPVDAFTEATSTGPGLPPPKTAASVDHVKLLTDGFTAELTPEQRDRAVTLIRDNASLFSTSEFDIGRTDLIKHTIDTGEHKPFKQQLRRHPWSHQDVIDQHVDKMLQTGVISPTVSPWASNVVLVKKASGDLRFCVDFRQLNRLTVKDSYPLSRIDSCMDALGRAKFFSTLDLRSGYWQVELDKDSSEKTAFVTRKGVYKFNVLAFGLSNAPAIFQRLMDMLLIGLNWQICLAFLDDVIVISSTFDEHLDRLNQVFARFKAANLKLNAGKCHLLQKAVRFLGSIVSENGIAPDPEKIQTLKDWPVPNDLKQVQSFVAFAGYYRRHIEHFTDHARPLHRLSCKDTPFLWGDNEQKAFETLRDKLMSAPVVKAPLPDGLFILDTDASDEGLGACLQQEQGPNKDVFVIAYASKSIQESERNYCTTRKELLAIVFGLKKFRPFLLGRKFLLRTDHAALTSLLKTPEPVGQQARWLDLLAEYPMDVQHRAGKQHINADVLSRRPCDRTVTDKPCAQKQCPRGEPALYCPADEVDVPGCRQEVITTVRPVVERGVKTKETIREATFDTEQPVVPRHGHLTDSGRPVVLGPGP